MDIRITYDDVYYTNDDKLFIMVNNLKINDNELGNQEISVMDKIGSVILEYTEPKMYYEMDEDYSKTTEEIIEGIQIEVQKILDEKAQSMNYDDGFTLASYYDSTVPKFKKEAEEFIIYRDLCWSKCYEILNSFTSGEIRRPTINEVMEVIKSI